MRHAAGDDADELAPRPGRTSLEVGVKVETDDERRRQAQARIRRHVRAERATRVDAWQPETH
jgi:acyl-CoA hydrolase